MKKNSQTAFINNQQP